MYSPVFLHVEVTNPKRVPQLVMSRVLTLKVQELVAYVPGGRGGGTAMYGLYRYVLL